MLLALAYYLSLGSFCSESQTLTGDVIKCSVSDTVPERLTEAGPEALGSPSLVEDTGTNPFTYSPEPVLSQHLLTDRLRAEFSFPKDTVTGLREHPEQRVGRPGTQGSTAMPNLERVPSSLRISQKGTMLTVTEAQVFKAFWHQNPKILDQSNLFNLGRASGNLCAVSTVPVSAVLVV